MANLIEYLTEQDKKNILTWIERYSIGAKDRYKDDYEPFPTSVDAILAEWARAKEKLFHLFGDQLIISKQITIGDDPLSPPNRMKMYERVTKKCALRTAMLKYIVDHNWPHNDKFYFTTLFFEENLLENKVPSEYTFTLGDGAEYKMRKGQKITRAIPNLARKMNIDEELIHTFLNEHSMVINEMAPEVCELCLSIHPLDFMTMSDNDNKWSSCMKWRYGGGAYRVGTIEMMNSPSVICVYLKSHSKKLAIPDTDFIWNSKKWRELFIMNDDLIASVKGYPYQNKILEEKVLSILAQLSPERYKAAPMWVYPDEYYNYPWGITYFEFLTNYMYNDISENNNPIRVILSNDFLANTVDDYSFNYGGKATCIFCGEPIKKASLNEDVLVCSNCRKEKPRKSYICELPPEHVYLVYPSGHRQEISLQNSTMTFI